MLWKELIKVVWGVASAWGSFWTYLWLARAYSRWMRRRQLALDLRRHCPPQVLMWDDAAQAEVTVDRETLIRELLRKQGL